MSRCYAFIALLGIVVALDAAAGQQSDVGQRMMPRLEAQFKVGSRDIPWRYARIPFTAEKVQGDWLWTSSAWVKNDQVIPFENAESYYDQQLQLDPNHVAARTCRAIIYADRHDLLKALDELNTVLRQAADDAFALYSRGVVYDLQGNTEEALTDFSKAVELDPRYLDAFAERGSIYSRLGQYDKAIADFSRVISLDPQDTYAYFNRGVMREAKGQRSQAINDYSQAIRIDSKNAFAYNNRGLAHHADKRFDSAISDFTRAITINAQDWMAYNNRGMVKIAKRDYDGAIRDFAKAAEINPNNPLFYKNRALAYEAKRQYETAVENYSKAIEINPQYALAYNNRAWLRATCPQADVRDAQLALEDARRACELSQWAKPEFLSTLAAAAAEAGNYSEAIDWETKAMNLSPRDDKFQSAARQRLSVYRQQRPFRVNVSTSGR